MMRAMVGERIEEGFAALTLESDARGGLVAVFVPEAGMICCSLRHRGEELLGQRNGLRAYVDHYSTMGIPFLHPWANRLGGERFELGGGAGGGRPAPPRPAAEARRQRPADARPPLGGARLAGGAPRRARWRRRA